ncbi:class I SAM-dependent methyltransferase [Brachybacterium sp. ACRRE]|uniref:class I SAM-dependent methyltransferase n=1 Tax=Brachybacterium sp. ACRRE TaxID=2918184 RepID=UPI001EF3174D|nr:class I SAM-dependent methyltransferase [Brachybacterium sp. ACRRE]MCG7309622.1 class I SAM-dependent methyltransferase [Brachybacterium sp. ACRRE]
MKHADFTELAENYSKYRVGYAPEAIKALVALLGASSPRIVDVGAGTGILTRQLAAESAASVLAVEPNDAMREAGIRDSAEFAISYQHGSAEQTGLPDASADLVTMGSSFHWPDTDMALQEFHRVLADGGYFAAMWNPRLVDRSPVLSEIESALRAVAPGLERKSAGLSGFPETLTERFLDSELFSNPVYIEGHEEVTQTLEQYLGVWRSVNDIPVQIGSERFEEFLEKAAQIVARHGGKVTTTYRTRIWAARKKD